MANKKNQTSTQKRLKIEKSFGKEVVDQLLHLSTAGFGLAAALAWNETIKTVIEEYIKPYTSVGSGLISQLLYALLITLLAVAITYELTKLSQKFGGKK